MKNFVCIDIGGTAMKYGIIDESGEIVERKECATEACKGGPAILEKVVGIVDRCVKARVISGVCISTAGMVDTEKGEIFYASPLIPDYTGTKFKEVLEEKFEIPCEVENDVNCAGLAEYRSGAARGSKVTLCLTVGTGIGGCILVDGKVFHGYSNSACEVGYMHMGDSDFQTLGATSILCKKVEMKKEGKLTGNWSGKRIFEEAISGDEICKNAIEEMVDTLGKGIANICYVMNPEVVVLGGGVMAQKEYLLPRLEIALKKYLVPSIAEHTALRVAEHKNNAGMLGAFYHFQNIH